GTNSLFLDIESLRQPLGNDRSLVFQGLGAADGYSFDAFQENGAVRFSLPVGGFFKQNFPLGGLPFYPMHAAVASQTIEQTPDGPQFVAQVSRRLSQAGLGAQQQGTLARLFGALVQRPNEFTTANGPITTSRAAVQLGIPDDSEDDGYRAVDGPEPIPALKQTTTQTFEVGYKGVLGDRVIVNIDAYYERKEDFIGPLVIESPLVYLQEQGLTQDAATALGQVFGTTSSPTVQGLLRNLESSGVPPSQVASLLGSIIGSGLNNTPTAVVQPDEQILPNGGGPNEVGAMLTYRNFGNVEYWGVDASVQAQVTDQFDAFANVSFISDDFFDNEELDEENESLSLALNAPQFKAKGGVDYRLDGVGLSFGASGNYVEGFPVESGPYVGDVDSYFLLDAHVGYEFTDAIPGLNASLTAKNVLDNEHREFVGAPELGFMLMGRLTYTLP
ncbi:MAG: TonB-dependent receptor domain-containing protein, partial [Salinibacter sp.]|uniref:TonB-dependent receptor domain-containing protein n=1 Tax=Salinibacter sp. TaxID=2065818 RepID=UPI0035D4DA68